MPTKIEWTDETWNPITGCSMVSPGCTNCYAMRLAGGRLRNHPSRAGLTKASTTGPVWTGAVRLNAEWLDQPLRWRRPRRVFVVAHGDLFHESVPEGWIDRVFAVMSLARRHHFQVLTKRPERARSYLLSFFGRYCDETIERLCDQAVAITNDPAAEEIVCGMNTPLSNVWLGVSVEDQQRADERIPLLLDTPAAVRFVSAEPLLAPVTMTPFLAALDWVIVGGESGPHARPMHPDWARSLRDQCQAAGVRFFFKQWGEYGEHRRRVGKRGAGRLLDGRTWEEYPT